MNGIEDKEIVKEPKSIATKYCVIVPTYNNAKTLSSVLSRILEVFPARDLIVINDGSTDETPQILQKIQGIHLISKPKNQGKGLALRTGFKEALKLGYTHAITIDSDGQHYPEDIPTLLEVSREHPHTLYIGSRNMQQEGVPSKSSFGNKFSNFWFWFETGIKLQDTQSGFRVYPIAQMPKRWFSTKFEFEIEAIVRAAWRDIKVENYPIQIKYDKEERVSHFRPFQDFSRISVLNTILVTITLLYILPRNFIRSFKKKSFKDFIKEDVLGANDSPKVKALSLALGVFIGIIPIWGLQTAAVLFLAVAFRLNKLLAFAASNVSIPPMIPFIVLASLKIGSLLFGNKFVAQDYLDFTNIKTHLAEYIVGSFILALISASTVGLTTYFLLKIRKK